MGLDGRQRRANLAAWLLSPDISRPWWPTADVLATMAISVLTGVTFGILPALRSSNLAPLAALKEDTRELFREEIAQR